MRGALRIRTLPLPRPAALVVPRFYSDKPKASHPSKHKPVEPLGRTVADHTKQDESLTTGLPEEKEHSPPPELLASRSTPDLFTLRDRTIIITGGGRGLGLTVAQALLECGANVAAADLLPEPSEPAWSEAQSFASSKGLSLSYDVLDVTKRDAVQAFMKKTFRSAPQTAPVRGLYVSAGIQLMKPALDFTFEDIRKILDVNLAGSFLCAQAFASEYIGRRGKVPGGESGLAEEGGASIVMTGSMSGHIANFGLECAAYNASKAGVNQLGKNLAMEWGKKGIRVNTLSPGYIRTAMTAALLEEKPELNETWLRGSLLGRLSTPDEFRGPVVFLLSDASSFMTGADILVDGGHTAT